MNHSGQFEYFLFENNKEIKSVIIDCKRNGDAFYVNVNIPHTKGTILKGVFWETIKDDKGRIGGNDMYIIDTLR